MNSSSSSSSMSNPANDKLGISQNKYIIDQFEPGERVLLSTLIIKVNQNQKKQERIFLISSRAVYNIVPESGNMFMKFMGKIIPKNTIKRRIKLSSIFGVSVSTIGSEFVIHVPTEYDYRFQSAEFRKTILEILIEAYYKVNLKKMPFFFKEDFTLVSVCTTENDVKKGINRLPTEMPINMDVQDFRERSSQGGQSELIFQRQGQSIKNSNVLSIEDFDLIKVLGRGAFGKVMMCEKKDNKELYAIKSLRKEHILDKNQIEHTKAERKLLEQIQHPFLISLEYAFQTTEKVFFVMRFMRGGELFKHLRDKRRFPESTAKFYAASILLAIEYLHKMNVVYRDLKPENILMDEQGYVKMTDYGLAKFIQPGTLTYSFVGTPEYLAPEIIRQQGHSFEVDWWSLGILIYEMVVGRPPFFSNNQHQLFKAIVESELVFPSQLPLSQEVKDLITQLLKKVPSQRLGSNGDGDQIKQHQWFKDYPFNDLEDKKLKAPIIPVLIDKMDVQNFDAEFTREDPTNSLANMDPKMVEKFKQEFGGVTYVPQDGMLQ